MGLGRKEHTCDVEYPIVQGYFIRAKVCEFDFRDDAADFQSGVVGLVQKIWAVVLGELGRGVAAGNRFYDVTSRWVIVGVACEEVRRWNQQMLYKNKPVIS